MDINELKRQLDELRQSVASLNLMAGMHTDDKEFAARLRVIERQVEVLVNDPQDKSLVKSVRILNDSVERLQKQLAPDAVTKIPRLVSPFIKAIAESLLGEIRTVSEAHETGLKTLRGEFKSLASSIDGAVANLTALADRSTELAARRLMDAARSFSAGDIQNHDGLKASGLIESHLLNKGH